jgi:zinc protease
VSDPARPDLHVTEVDGVPTIWSSVPGPLRAALLFRVGQADETLVTAGTTHLVEHLALFGLGRPGDHSNGQVDQTTTMFHCLGDEASAVEFFGSVTRQLGELPVGRLEDERNILRAEAAARKPSLESLLLTWRYGAAGYGLANQPQLGIEQVAAARLEEWSGRFMTRGNAVLWLSGPPPAGLRLALPDGEAMPAPDPRPSILPAFPAWFEGPGDMVGLSAVLERGYDNHALADVLRRRLVDELRTRRAVAYSPDTFYRALSGEVGQLLATSDLVSGRQSDGVRPFCAALADLAEPGNVTEEEVAAWRDRTARDMAEPYAPLGMLSGNAFELIHGRPLIGLEERAREVAAVRPEQVTEAAASALATALACIPGGVRLSRDSWSPAPGGLEEPLDGPTYQALGGEAGRQTLVVSREGLTLRWAGHHLTVPVASTAAVQHWPDGRRVLTALDANRVVVEPTLWQGGRGAVEQIDRYWPPELRVAMPERPGDQVPAPGPTPARLPGAAPTDKEKEAAKERRGALVGIYLFGVLGLAFLVAGLATQLPGAVVPAAIFGYSTYTSYRKYRALRPVAPAEDPRHP